jgi:hypothetical protein
VNEYVAFELQRLRGGCQNAFFLFSLFAFVPFLTATPALTEKGILSTFRIGGRKDDAPEPKDNTNVKFAASNKDLKDSKEGTPTGTDSPSPFGSRKNRRPSAADLHKRDSLQMR